MGYVVITTIQAPTDAVLNMVTRGLQQGFRTIIIGDRKTPAAAWPEGAAFFSLSEQRSIGFRLGSLLPENHYARKNLGYLLAMSHGSPVIFDTDDDNAPLTSWRRRHEGTVAQRCAGLGWTNAYQWFMDGNIWPRGFPLEQIRAAIGPAGLGAPAQIDAPIQQGLANGSPDVDAIWRLTLDQEVTFRDRDSVYLPSGAWCPFNSQSTWWFPDAYPLMYLPSLVSFRMTDIWRSFVAQRCLWELGLGVVFHGPEMLQERNPHNLLRDFEQEIPGYLGNARLCKLLEATQLSSKPTAAGENLYRCYEQLVGGGFVPAQEMPMIEAWLCDVQKAGEVRSASAESTRKQELCGKQ